MPEPTSEPGETTSDEPGDSFSRERSPADTVDKMTTTACIADVGMVDAKDGGMVDAKRILFDDDVPDVIEFYGAHEKWGFLSNFYASTFSLRGKEWPSVEHYFQAMKYHDTYMEEKIRTCGKPARAKKLGNMRLENLGITPEWDRVKEKIMSEALWAKFTQSEELLARLLGTGYAELVEHTCKDRYWGDGGNGGGLNRLGRLIERVRRVARERVQGSSDGEERRSESGEPEESSPFEPHEWSRSGVARNRSTAAHRARRKKFRDRNRRDAYRGGDGRSLFEAVAGTSTGASLVSDGGINVPLSALPPRGRDVVRRNQYQRRWDGAPEECYSSGEEEDPVTGEDAYTLLRFTEEMWVCCACTLHNSCRTSPLACDVCEAPRVGTEEMLECEVSRVSPPRRPSLIDFLV